MQEFTIKTIRDIPLGTTLTITCANALKAQSLAQQAYNENRVQDLFKYSVIRKGSIISVTKNKGVKDE